jgi:hypothetical protein
MLKSSGFIDDVLHETEPLYCHLVWHLMKVILVIVIIGDNAVLSEGAVKMITIAMVLISNAKVERKERLIIGVALNGV